MQLMDLIDKSILFLMSLTLYLQVVGLDNSVQLLVTILITLIAATLLSYTDHLWLQHTIVILFIVSCLFVPALTFFLPVIVYAWLINNHPSFQLITLVTYSYFYSHYGLFATLTIIALTGVAALIKYRTVHFARSKINYHDLEDRTKELTYTLKQQHQQLLESQDQEIHLATLNERHRIAREIHDHVGHVLSRALLQIGALLSINADSKLTPHLQALRSTLGQGMDNIRTSVHDLHDTAIDLEATLKKLVDEFTFCPIELDLHISELPNQPTKYAIIAIINEGFSNIIKHSDASFVTLRLREHQDFYQLILSDNGQVLDYSLDSGIGLSNIRERIEKLNGHLHIDLDTGFKLFITLPKNEV